MKKRSISILISSACLLAALFACKDKTPEAECGCNGPTISKIKDQKVVHLGRNVFKYETEDSTAEASYLVVCNPDSAWMKDNTILMRRNYVISGEFKKECGEVRTDCDKCSTIWTGPLFKMTSLH